MKGLPVAHPHARHRRRQGARRRRRAAHHANPALGLRAIRYCLAEPQMFNTQLRAILRASRYGKVRILIPMLAHAHELDQALALIAPGASSSSTSEAQPYDATCRWAA